MWYTTWNKCTIIYAKFLNKMLEDDEIRESYYGYLISVGNEYSIQTIFFWKGI